MKNGTVVNAPNGNSSTTSFDETGIRFDEENGQPVVVMTASAYNMMIDELEALQDAIDALVIRAELANEGGETTDWETFKAELNLNAILD